ncbi:MAG: hypothetical protein ACXVA0_20635 [Mucilaginibacter sp.]
MNLVDAAKATANKIRKYVFKLEKSDLEAALALAEIYGEFLIFNHVGIYSDMELEKHLAERFLFLTPSYSVKKSGVLHLMSAAYAHGGHTRVVEKLLNDGMGDALASLDKIPESVLLEIPECVVIYDNIRSKSNIETVIEIFNIGCQYDSVVLHIHPSDILSAIAAVLIKKHGGKVYFYNHADHLFSFGYYGTEKVFEISRLGWRKGVARQIEDKQTFVGIPISYKQNFKEVKDSKKRAIMSGSPNKFVPCNEYSVTNFLNQLFETLKKKDQLEVIICGPTGQEAHWKGLKDNARDHISFLGVIPYADYLHLVSSADLYIDSFPLGNGSAFPEAVLLGIPCFGLDIMGGSSYADSLRSHSVVDLVEKVRRFIDDSAFDHLFLNKVREQIIANQSIEACIRRIKIAMKGESNVPLPSQLDVMFCREDFFEEYWRFNNKLNFYFTRMPNLSLMQSCKAASCWTDTWPYKSTISLITRLIIKMVKQQYRC